MHYFTRNTLTIFWGGGIAPPQTQPSLRKGTLPPKLHPLDVYGASTDTYGTRILVRYQALRVVVTTSSRAASRDWQVP